MSDWTLDSGPSSDPRLIADLSVLSDLRVSILLLSRNAEHAGIAEKEQKEEKD